MANMCQTLHCLPAPGGYLDQDWVQIRLLEEVYGAQAELMDRRTKTLDAD